MAPSSDIEASDHIAEDQTILAGRADRLMAAIVDGVILVCLIFGVFFLVGMVSDFSFTDDYFLPAAEDQLDLTITIISLIVAQVSFVLVNGHLLLKNGQTIGKKMVGIRIIGQQGELPGLERLWLARNTVPAALNMVPVLGTFFSIVNVLFIFGPERRCLHDHIAGTRVIKA